MQAQHILCIKRSQLESIFGSPLFEGTKLQPPHLQELFNLPLTFINRESAEVDSQWKQLIPYLVLTHRGRLFVYRREKRVKEGRLAGLKSIGIGGHIDREDAEASATFEEIYKKALWRELSEEIHGITIKDLEFPQFIGWINDESNPVGQVHFGAVHVLEVPCVDNITINRNEHLSHLGWITAQEVIEDARGFETWSVLAARLMMTSKDQRRNLCQDR